MQLRFCERAKRHVLNGYKTDAMKALVANHEIPAAITNCELVIRYIDAVLMEAVALGASEIFFRPAVPICFSVHEQLVAVNDMPINEEEIKALVGILCSRENAVTDLLSGRAVSTRYSVVVRTEAGTLSETRRFFGFRVQVNPIVPPRGSGEASAQIILRPIAVDPPMLADVGLSESLASAMSPSNGLVYVAGATGSGKSTTLAAVIRWILESENPLNIKGNVCTVEEPIEYTFDKIKTAHSIVAQSQVPEHFPNFESGIRAFMRSAPRLILVGEMRDSESVKAGIEASLTGHPVMTTVHATDVPSIFRRLLTRFPSGEEPIFDIIDTARVAIAQRLIPRVGGGRVALRQVLEFKPELRSQLYQVDDINRLTDLLRKAVETHGQTFAKHAKQLFDQGLIDENQLELASYYDG